MSAKDFIIEDFKYVQQDRTKRMKNNSFQTTTVYMVTINCFKDLNENLTNISLSNLYRIFIIYISLNIL